VTARIERPVSGGIKRAAESAGIQVDADLDRTDEELDALRDLAARAELIFEHDGETGSDPSNVLREALRSAGNDFALLGDEVYSGGGTATSMTFRRAELRCELALAVFAYRSEFGYTESDNDATESAAEGGAS
jgi:hypothetical protein